MADTPEASEAAVRQALQTVLDPELGESIVDLGLVLRIEIAPLAVHLVLIPTSATCPMSDLLLEDAAAAVRQACPDGTAVSVVLDWDTPWSAERLSPALKTRFGW